MDWTTRIRRAPTLALRMALDQVQTVAGALRIRAAERDGLSRPGVLRAADKRIAELRGEDPAMVTPLVVEGAAVETERLAWEATHRPASRIVEAVGRGRWTGRL